MQIFRTFSLTTSFVCVSKQPVLAKSLFCKVPVLAKSLLWQRACSGIFLKLFAWSIFLTQRWLKSQQHNFFRCMLSLLYSFGLFVCGFFNFLPCFFFFCFCIFFLTCVKSSWLSFRFFSPPFCLLVYIILFWLFFVLSFVLFCFVFGFVSCFLSFRTSSPRNFVLLLVCVHFLLFIFVHSFFFLVFWLCC